MKYRLALVCSAALLSAAAFGGDDTKMSKSQDETFKSLDVDADGRLSKSEAAGSSSISSSFAKLDADADGYVSKKEFRANTMSKPESPTRY